MMRLLRLRLSIFIGVTFYTVEKQDEAAADAITAPPRLRVNPLIRCSGDRKKIGFTLRREDAKVLRLPRAIRTSGQVRDDSAAVKTGASRFRMNTIGGSTVILAAPQQSRLGRSS
jgi:hypothetical protein